METATISRPHELAATGPVVVGVDDPDAARDAAALGYRLAEALGRDVLFTRVSGRSPADGLRALAAEQNAAAVVVGPGRTGERLLANASVPVAIAPEGYAETDSRIATVGSGFDGSPNSRVALDWASAVARSAGAFLRVIGVHEPVPVDRFALTRGLASPSFTRVIREQQEKRLAIGAVEVGAGLSVEPELRDGTTADALVDASLTLDLLVIGSRGLGALRGAVLGSVSTAVVRAAHSPVVVVPASPR